MNIFICDDDPNDMNRLKELLSQYDDRKSLGIEGGNSSYPWI